ncbi:MAG: TonB-dependent receptor [Schleiferiaceae bacterium]
MEKRIVLSLIALLSLTTLWAQNGTVRGTVYDKDNGETMIGAAVTVEGVPGVAGGSDLDGAYTLSLPAGTYTLKSSYISYQDVKITEVVVVEGEVTVIDFYLPSSTEMLGEVVVEAKASRNTENAVILMQKNATAVMDGISSQTIRKMGDSDAAGAIKRVTGVSVEGGKYVTVRGLGDRYSKTLLNGAEIPSLDPEKNAVQLDLFPTNLIDNMLVYKTFTADKPADFTGGLINLTTKDFPEKFTVQASAQLGFNEQSTMNSNFLTYKGSSTDWLGYDNGTRSAPANAESLPQDVSGFLGNLDQNRQTVQEFNPQMNSVQGSTPLNQSYSLSVGNQSTLFGKKVGFLAAGSYRYRSTGYDNGFVGRYTATSAENFQTLRQLNDQAWNESVLWGLMFNGNIRLNDNNKLGFTYMRNQSGDKTARSLFGKWDEFSTISPTSNDYFYTQTLNWIERSIATYQLKGEHNIESWNHTKIDWISSYTNSSQDQPDLRYFAYDKEGNTYQISSQAYQDPTRFFRSMDEVNWDNRINAETPFLLWNDETAKLKFGGSYTTKKRNFQELQYDYIDYNNSFNGSIEDFIAFDNIITSFSDTGYFMVSNRQLSNTYEGNQSVMGAYATADLPLTSKLKATAGVRFETTNITVESLNPNDAKGSISKFDILPGLNFTYSLNDLMNLRFGYSRTLARPTFRELAPFSSYLFAGDFTYVGNPNLDRTLIDNFDFRWEWYPAPGDFLSASAFYKRFNNPIERQVQPKAANQEITFLNVPEANVAGIELEARKLLGFISDENNQFKVGANVSLIYARTTVDEEEYQARLVTNPNASRTRPMYGQSPYIVNAYTSYTNTKSNFSTTLSFNQFGERLMFVSRGAVPDVYEQPRPQLDLTLEKGIGEHFTIGVKAQNLLNPDNYMTHEFNGESYDFARFTTGRVYSIKVKYLL